MEERGKKKKAKQRKGETRLIFGFARSRSRDSSEKNRHGERLELELMRRPRNLF